MVSAYYKMANLITEKQKSAVRLDYYIRLVSVCLIILSTLGLFLLVYIIPYYVSLSKKEAQVAEQFEAMVKSENKGSANVTASQIVSQTLDKMKAVELSDTKSKPSIYYGKILQSKNTNISLSKISYSLVKGGEVQMVVSGISLDREGLVAFIEDLKVKGGFATVESPVSDFAKDRNIAFTLNITAKI
jgi:hypothetical protein